MSEVLYPRESVYNALPKEEARIEKPPRYMSKFRPTIVLQEKLTKDTRKTMGPAKVEVPSPEKYLKKHSKEPERKHCSKETCAGRKPAVPLRTDKPPMGIHTKRDFLKTAIMVPMKPQPTCVDTCKGHKELLENSGLVPKYIRKKDFGEVPEYLLQRKEEERRAQEEYDRYVKEQREQGAMKHLSDQERQDVLESLKKNWEQLYHEYQGLPLVTDTLSRKSNKQRLEAAMKQLESDINLVERFKTIYIANN
ncbi:enkurin [Aulostomus maculatus]